MAHAFSCTYFIYECLCNNLAWTCESTKNERYFLLKELSNYAFQSYKKHYLESYKVIQIRKPGDVTPVNRRVWNYLDGFARQYSKPSNFERQKTKPNSSRFEFGCISLDFIIFVVLEIGLPFLSELWIQRVNLSARIMTSVFERVPTSTTPN